MQAFILKGTGWKENSLHFFSEGPGCSCCVRDVLQTLNSRTVLLPLLYPLADDGVRMWVSGCLENCTEANSGCIVPSHNTDAPLPTSIGTQEGGGTCRGLEAKSARPCTLAPSVGCRPCSTLGVGRGFFYMPGLARPVPETSC